MKTNLKLLSLILLIIGLFISGTLEKSNENIQKLVKNEISDGSNKLVLVTLISTKKTKGSSEYNFSTVIEEQSLVFYHKNGLIKKVNLPIPKMYVETLSGDSIKVVENVIYELGVLNGKKQNLFITKGQGHCNACPEFFGIYDELGNTLWSSYSNKYITFMTFGDFEEAFKISEADSLNWESGNFKKVDISW